jgi:hypothetical protein
MSPYPGRDFLDSPLSMAAASRRLEAGPNISPRTVPVAPGGAPKKPAEAVAAGHRPDPIRTMGMVARLEPIPEAAMFEDDSCPADTICPSLIADGESREAWPLAAEGTPTPAPQVDEAAILGQIELPFPAFALRRSLAAAPTDSAKASGGHVIQVLIEAVQETTEANAAGEAGK